MSSISSVRCNGVNSGQCYLFLTVSVCNFLLLSMCVLLSKQSRTCISVHYSFSCSIFCVSIPHFLPRAPSFFNVFCASHIPLIYFTSFTKVSSFRIDYFYPCALPFVSIAFSEVLGHARLAARRRKIHPSNRSNGSFFRATIVHPNNTRNSRKCVII